LCEDLSVPLNSEAAVKEVLARISSIFAEDEDPTKGEGKNCVTLSSTHKFKGLERERACLLWDTYRPGDGDEERNLSYVACTRAKTHLVYVKGKLT
jgi:superfamily I DNA/RNA helicase